NDRCDFLHSKRVLKVRKSTLARQPNWGATNERSRLCARPNLPAAVASIRTKVTPEPETRIADGLNAEASRAAMSTTAALTVAPLRSTGVTALPVPRRVTAAQIGETVFLLKKHGR